ncbi:hypothetical protein BU23DRAFT_601933 [Bimuria novae-zelandiae CBS 107.79]|uniref:Uncharacterized protein n=1 Tax=Bimuria novae-zelandiae CBS 107.79 TaxID=1447943 RepID=A0A6A5UYC0_9PLEO|nr:hypothetical protein BU23DRAFT_601933 [Bimuria novae-zelandiae CBS 107.79]
MPFELSTVSKDEGLRDIVAMLFKAYNHTSAFVNAIYPRTLTPDGIEGLDTVTERLQWLRDNDPSTRWFKETDTSTGAIVSASQWNVYDKEKPPEMMLDGAPPNWFSSDADNKYAVEMIAAFIGPRYKRYREADAPIMCLNIMGTAIEALHRGAASM